MGPFSLSLLSPLALLWLSPSRLSLLSHFSLNLKNRSLSQTHFYFNLKKPISQTHIFTSLSPSHKPISSWVISETQPTLILSADLSIGWWGVDLSMTWWLVERQSRLGWWAMFLAQQRRIYFWVWSDDFWVLGDLWVVDDFWVTGCRSRFGSWVIFFWVCLNDVWMIFFGFGQMILGFAYQRIGNIWFNK